MDKNIYGQGHGRIIPDELLAKTISLQVFEKALDENITPHIALANAEFEGDLVCGKKVNFIRRDTNRPSIWQDTQGNEEPEVDVIELCADEVQICGSKDINIKLSVHQLKQLQCEGLDGIYFDTVDKTIGDSLETMWDESHLATMIMQTDAQNTGNNALDGLANLGSPANPIVIPQGRDAAADALEQVFSNLQLVLQTQNAMNLDGDTALILPTIAANRAMPIFRDLNTCCGEDNVRVKGQLPKTVYGFDSIRSNRRVLSTVYNGRRIHYIVAGNKSASGFVTDIYNLKWWEGKRDWFLVGTEVHGSYVVQPEELAVAVVAFA